MKFLLKNARIQKWIDHNSDEKWLLPISTIVILALLWGDGTLPSLGVVAGMILFLSVVNHYIRKLLFPYMKMEDFFKKAEETSLGAAIIVVAVLGFSAFLIHSAVVLLSAVPR